MRFPKLGPGLLLAATSIGGSHLVMAPTAGARFGYELLWLVIVAHFFKYHAFEFGPRYAVASGASLLDGYRRLPGPRNWAVWAGLIDMVLESVGVLAAVAGLTGSILQGAFGGLGIPAWTLLSIVTVFALLYFGKYQLLTRTSTVMLLFLALGTTIAFVARPPAAGDLRHLVMPSLPTGSLLLVSAILGWMPTGVGVSIWHSLWLIEDPRFSARESSSVAERFARGLRDMRIGYALSAVLGLMFLSLGAAVLHPRGLTPEGPETALTLSRLYTEILGGWMQPVFLTIAFFAMFSTTYTVMDGMPRTLVAAIRHIRREPDADRGDRGKLYWSYLVGMTTVSVIVVRLFPDPVLLLTVLGAVTFVFSPVYCLLNYLCVTRLIEDESMRPTAVNRWIAKAGVAFMAGTLALFIYTEIILEVFQS